MISTPRMCQQQVWIGLGWVSPYPSRLNTGASLTRGTSECGSPHSRPTALCLALNTRPRHPGQAGGAAAGTDGGGALHLEAPSIFFFFEIVSFQITRLLGGYGSKQRHSREMTQLPVEGLWPAGKTFHFCPPL